MSPDVIKSAFEARLKAVGELRALAEQAEGRDFTAEERSTEERLNGDIDRLDKKIQTGLADLEREKRAIDAMDKFSAVTKGAVTIDGPKDQRTNVRTELRSQLRDVAERKLNYLDVTLEPEHMRTRPDTFNRPRYESRALGVGVGTTVPVPSEFVSSLYEVLLDTSTVRQTNPTVLTTGSGNAIDFPRATAHGTVAWLAEAGLLAGTDPTLSKITLNAFKVGALLYVSTELLQDEGFDVVDYLARHGGENIALAADVEYVNGTNPTTRPSGIIPAVSVGATMPAGNPTGFTTAGSADSLMDLYYSVNFRYRARGSWLGSDTVIKSLRKVKDTTNQYIWQPGLQLGVPDTVLGRPVYSDPNVPVPANAVKGLLFGDFRSYIIREVRTVRFERSDDFRFSTDEVAFRVVWRTDGKLIDTNGLKALQFTT
jgi:HK97 family phage major capsid protein